MGTIAQKGSRLAETKALLKQRLTEKGVDVSSEDVFYRLADKVGDIANGGGIVYTKIPDSAFSKESTYLLRCNLSEASQSIPSGFKAAFLCIGFEGPTLTGTGMALYSEEFNVSLSGPFNGIFCTGVGDGLIPFYWSVSGDNIEFDTSEADVIVPKMFYPMNSPFSFFVY